MLRSARQLLVGVGLLSSLMALFYFSSPALAVTAADWNAGNIMDDGVFFSPTEMSTADIQNFLNSKVPVCDIWHAASNGNNPPFTCLKDYIENPTTHQNNANGGVVSGGWSAAQIIKHAADSYNINPKVLIVLLQKEQSLITDDWPWVAQYRSATGFGCPDTAPCDAEYYGFYNQVMNAARQFRRYATYPTEYRYKAFQSNFIQYNPNVSCGGTNVVIANQATAGLYNYTPYQPNASALANLYGSGDACGAYGNRNFWRMYSDWFGSTSVNFSTKDTDVTWQFEKLIGNSSGIISDSSYTGATPTSVTLNGILYVFYYNFTNKSLDAVYADNTGWHKVIIDGANGVATNKSTGDVGLHPSATVYNNQVHVSYYDNAGDLRYAKGSIGSWSAATLDGAGGSDGRVTGNVGVKSKLLSYAGSLQLFYYDSSNNNLRHAWSSGSQGWKFENLDGDNGSIARNNGDVGLFSSAIDYAGSLQLFYYDSSNNNLRHAWSSGSQGWKFENLDGDNGSIARNNGDAGIDVNAAYNPSTSKLLLTYKHGTGIKYVWANNTGWHFAYLDGASYSLTGQNFATPASNPIILPYGQSLQVFYSNSGVLKHAWASQ